MKLKSRKLNYELKILDDLIVNELNPIATTAKISKENLEILLQFAQNENSRIKSTVIQTVALESEENSIRCYIQRNQAGLIELADKLLYTIEHTEVLLKQGDLKLTSELIIVQKTIYLIIEDLLHFIENRYLFFCNYNLKIPEKYKLFCINEFIQGIEEIKAECYSSESSMLNLGISPIEEIIKNPKVIVSYKRLVFCKELLKNLRNAVLRDREFSVDEKVFRVLVGMNFNSHYFVKYVTEKLKSELEKIDLIVDKLEYLFKKLKELNQIPTRAGVALFSRNVSVNEVLSTWIFEEVFFLEKKIQLEKLIKYETDKQYSSENKINTDLSVPQIACFVRLFVETGIFKNSNKEEILKFIPSIYRSKRMGEFAYGSFRSKYYGILESTKEDVREMLFLMINELKKL